MSQTIFVHDSHPTGTQTKLAVAAPALIVPGFFTCGIIVVTTAGSAGVLTLNDVATLAGAASGNQVVSIAYNATVLATNVPYAFRWPFLKGIVISAVPTGMVLNISWG